MLGLIVYLICKQYFVFHFISSVYFDYVIIEFTFLPTRLS